MQYVLLVSKREQKQLRTTGITNCPSLAVSKLYVEIILIKRPLQQFSTSMTSEGTGKLGMNKHKTRQGIYNADLSKVETVCQVLSYV